MIIKYYKSTNFWDNFHVSETDTHHYYAKKYGNFTCCVCIKKDDLNLSELIFKLNETILSTMLCL